MKLFVTGSTGFIGSHFVKQGLASGFEIVAHRRTADSTPAIPLGDGVEWLTKPYEEIQANDLEGCDAIVHLAATGVTPKPATWEECFRFNAAGSLSLLQLAHQSGIRRFIAAGTYAEYGKAGLRFDPIPPDAPLEPTDPYAASKAAGGLAMAAFARANAMEFYYGRIFSAYGEGQSGANFWPQLREAAMAGKDFPMTPGGQTRDFIPVADVADMFLQACARKDLHPGEPMVRNVASGNPVTLIGFAEACWAEWGTKGRILAGSIPYRANEVMRYVPLMVP